MRRSGARRRVCALVAAALLTVACSDGGSTAPATALPPSSTPPATASTSTSTTAPPTATTTSTTVAPTTTQPPDPVRSAGWVRAENTKPGTTAWQIVDPPDNPARAIPDGWIEGFADRTSVRRGDGFRLFVDTPAATFTATAYRMGWYGGDRGRLVWESGPVPGIRQVFRNEDRRTGLAEAVWEESLTVDSTADWPPGSYLVKLETAEGGAHYAPITVRDDQAAGDLLFMNAVTTWQAYNTWGWCSLYRCYGPRAATLSRADVVSFDRPYANAYGQGSADFLTHELPLIAYIEELGLDVAYITNVDLHLEPSLAASRTALLSPGHDEYYSAEMRQALLDALDAGTNLAFFGANAIFRNIRLEDGDDGTGARRMVNYRRNDPGSGGDPYRMTINWRDKPLSRNEAEIVGIRYGCAGARGDLRVVNAENWIYAGTGARNGDRVRGILGIEIDVLALPELTPPGLEVIAASDVRCGDSTYRHISAYHSRPSGAGVFATGTIDWVCGLDGTCPRIARSELIRGMTANVLAAFAAGPAGLIHPSEGNSGQYRRR